MKAIILAAGKGSRLKKITKNFPKPMIEIKGKPILEHNIEMCRKAGIEEIFINLNHFPELIKDYFGNGSNFGVKITYKEQDKPRGLPDAFIMGEKFIGKENVAMILGDNFFYGQNLTSKLLENTKLKKGAKVVLHKVQKPESFGVAKIDKKNKPRIFANTVSIKDKTSKFNKSIFTVCDYRENDKCPPWSIQAKEISHDKIKKTIYYDHAILKFYLH